MIDITLPEWLVTVMVVYAVVDLVAILAKISLQREMKRIAQENMLEDQLQRDRLENLVMQNIDGIQKWNKAQMNDEAKFNTDDFTQH